MFTQCIEQRHQTELKYDYILLEHYRSCTLTQPAIDALAGTALGPMSATNAAAIQADPLPDWLSAMDKRETEMDDDSPDHPLILMVHE